MSVVDFLLKYYLWILVVLILIVITVIGFLADTKRKKNESKIKGTKLNEETLINNQPDTSSLNNSSIVSEPLPNITNGIQVTPIKNNSAIVTPNIIGTSNSVVSPTIPSQPISNPISEVNNLFPNPSENLTIQATAIPSNFATNQSSTTQSISNSSYPQVISPQPIVSTNPQFTSPVTSTPILSQVSPILSNNQTINSTSPQVPSTSQPATISQPTTVNSVPQTQSSQTIAFPTQPQVSTPSQAQGQVQSSYVIPVSNPIPNQNLNQSYQNYK